MSQENKSIYLQPTNGLGNRLRAINSHYKLALNTGRTLKVFWTSSQGFSDESFEDLFDMYCIDSDLIEFIDEDEFLEARYRVFRVDDYFKQDSSSNYLVKNSSKVSNIVLNHSFSIKTSSCIEYIFSCSNSLSDFYKSFSDNLFLSALKPSLKLKPTIDFILKKIDTKTLGIHIRKGDAINGKWKSKYLSPSHSEFFRKISSHNGKVFLSTDCKKTNESINSTFKGKIISNNLKKFTDPTLNPSNLKPYQGDAVIDMFCLSACFKIFGTKWSSFSSVSKLLSV